MAADQGPARGVNEQRLWHRHEAMGRHGATAKGGVNRQALSAEDIAARRTLAAWASARGYPTYLDEIGNLYVRRPGEDAAAAPVMTGSHLDSQPTGGRFDGTYGVLAGFEVLEALDDTATRTRRPIEVVAWTNEEGSRFQPGTMGSAVFAGEKQLADMVEIRDSKGARLGDALAETLAAMPEVERRPTGIPVAAYIEAHIEQGPRLVLEGRTIGVVTGIQGSRWFEIVVTGEEAHAGTTPLAARKDAFRSALAMASALQELMHDPADILRFTIGRFEVMPGSPNTVPGRVLFTIDFRHPDRAVLRERGERIAATCRAAAGPCQVSIRETTSNDPTRFDPAVVDLIRQSAATLGLPHMDIFSGAGHDARYMAPLCPTGMIFVPCEKGISHNEAENATPGDLAAGARVLADVLARLANR